MVSQEHSRLLALDPVGNVMVLRFTGPVIEAEATVEAIGRQVAYLVERGGHRHLVFDCAPLESVVSSLFSQFITIHKMLRRLGGRLVLCNLRPGLRDVFERLRLTQLFTVCDNEAEALRSVGSADPGHSSKG